MVGQLRAGGSTIQEQLAKIVYLTDKKTFSRKFQQIVLGVQIDRYFTKEEILAMYLNRVFLGENSVGVKQAAYHYFGIDIAKNPDQLTLAQAALLAGLPQAPSAYDPIKHPQAALKRRNEVLEAMAKYGYITEAAAKEAEQQPIGKLTYHSEPGDPWDTHPLFTNFLFDYADNSNIGVSTEELLQGGLKIYTTLDPKVQSAIDQVFWSTNYNGDFPGPTSGTVVQGAALFVDPTTGGILGGAGSRKQGFTYRGYDRIYAKQQAGSSIKPILEYGAAVDSGKWGPDSILDNTPQNFGTSSNPYTPRNDDGASAPAHPTMKYALATSQNVAAVWLLKQVGLDNAISYAERFGLTFTDADRQNGLANALGTVAVSPMEMAAAYEVYADGGVQEQVHLINKVVNAAGETIYSYQPAAKRVVSAQTAATMTQMLEGVVQYGTGTNAQVPGWDVAGKTGTIQYDATLNGAHQEWIKNAWFDGYTPNMVGSIYIAYDNPDAEHHLTGTPSAQCAKIFGDIARLATAGETPQHFNFGGDTTTSTQPTQTPVSGLTLQWDATIHALELAWTSTMQGQVNFIVKRSAGYPPGSTPPAPTGPNDPNYTVIGETNQLTLTDGSVQPGMTYTYVVEAVDSSGNVLTPSVSKTVTLQNDTQTLPGQTEGAGGLGNTGNTVGNTTGNVSGTVGGGTVNSPGPGGTSPGIGGPTGGTGGTGTGGQPTTGGSGGTGDAGGAGGAGGTNQGTGTGNTINPVTPGGNAGNTTGGRGSSDPDYG
ncbi:hypothetical protein GCM10025857_29060 [Alicyclobacillus contaminans]|nr:hypothetical protein GCM10025857_29060 [Alicyclobacillus contaminans]